MHNFVIKLFNNDVNDLTIEVVKIGLFVHSEKLIKLFNRSLRGESLRSTLSALGIGNFRLRTLEEEKKQLAKCWVFF